LPLVLSLTVTMVWSAKSHAHVMSDPFTMLQVEPFDPVIVAE
jgi:hypothetical protein